MLLFLSASLLPERALHGLNASTASFSALLLQAFGLPAAVRREFLSLGAFQVEIVPECTAVYLVILFGAFVLAHPTSMRKKIPGLVGGSALLILINAARISAVLYVGSRSLSAFHILHTYLGQVLMMLTAFGLCLWWARWAEEEGERRESHIDWGRLVLLSGVLFVVWLAMNRAYVTFNDGVVETLLAWRGQMIALERRHPIYFETFNLPFFIGLVLSTRSMSPAVKARGVLWGALLIWISHVMFRLGNVFLMLHQEKSVFLVTNGLVILSQYLLPFLVWFVVVRRLISFRPAPSLSR